MSSTPSPRLVDAPNSGTLPAQPLSPPRSWVLAAFLTIYIVWGSTYLGIKVAIETMPPLWMAGWRFLAAGGLLFAFLRLRGQRFSGRREWRDAWIVGATLLGGGNGGVTWAEQTVPSGIAALVVGSAPIWFALMGWLRPGGTRPTRRTWLGIAVGFTGLAILASPWSKGGSFDAAGMLSLLGACLSWAWGSLYSRGTPKPASPGLTVAAQMLCGGGVLLAASCLLGEPRGFHWSQVSSRSLLATLYLIIAGSWIGFSAYVWLLKVTSPTKVSSYAYVNPVVAVFLGWLVLGEPVTPRTGWAAGVIIVGVLVLTLPADLFRRAKSSVTS